MWPSGLFLGGVFSLNNAVSKTNKKLKTLVKSDYPALKRRAF